MDNKLKQRIKDFNKIPNPDNSKRIIFYTLKPEGMTIAPNKDK